MWNSLLNAAGAVGNVLDLPGSSVRDALSGRNPLDQWMTPLTDKNRTSGRDLLRVHGLAGSKDTWGNFAGGMLAEAALDPLNFVPGMSVAKAARAKVAAQAANRGIDAANAVARSHPAMVSPIVAGRHLVDDIPPAQAGVAGYLPDYSQDLIPGTRRMDRTADEYRASIPIRPEGYRSPGESAHGNYDYYSDARPAFQLQYTTAPSDSVADFAHNLNVEHAAKSGEYVMPHSNKFTKAGSIFSGPRRAPSSESFMDVIRGLNAGHALQQAVRQVQPGGSVRLIRQMPLDRNMTKQYNAMTNLPIDEMISAMDAHRLAQEVRPAPFAVAVQSSLPEISDRLIRANPESPRLPVPKITPAMMRLAMYNATARTAAQGGRSK